MTGKTPLLLAAGAALTVFLGGSAGAASAAPAAHSTAPAAQPTSHVPASTPLRPDSRCLVWWKETTNYAGMTAGYSWAWNVTVYPGASGDRVKEIQCLTDYHGQGPSALDGIYGPDTVAAVKRVQARCQFPPSQQDGIVGPQTWRCLRIEE
ncbi:peptidoglycan-binding domain-containing protein [Streptomyces sediminimaris]|uniref:peptidoglycan-binding domain-containing protein n=1 Tax=Streptomyces sediminimaris TaxID=3383721 RepID=UPI00399A2ADB